MSTIIDEFSFNHPENKGYGKWKRLRILSCDDLEYSKIEAKFNKGWKHPQKTRPKIHAIFKVLSSDSNLQPFHRYRALVISSPALRNRTKNPANEQLLFHGTNRFCGLVEDGSRVRLCSLSKCHLCSVIRNSFDVQKCGTKHKFRRFGTGIYTTACSSKADDYTLNGDESSKLRVLLVSRVIVGNPHKRRHNATDLIEPPCGHHSVIGEPGADLNYEETVVYNNDAIRPAYLIVYGSIPSTVGTKSDSSSVVCNDIGKDPNIQARKVTYLIDIDISPLFKSTMASHIPLALSLLGTLASHYPLGSMTQKAAPPPPPSVAPSAPTQSAPVLPTAPPITTPGPNPSGNANGTTGATANSNAGSSPPVINPVALCEACRLHLDFATIDLSTQMEQKCTISAAKHAPEVQADLKRKPQVAEGGGETRLLVTHKLAYRELCTRSNSEIATCQAPGCQNPPHPGGHDYCSLAHKTLGENLCLMCMQAPKMANSHFCSQPCIDDAESKGPMILEVPAGHVTFKSVADQFKASWRHVGTVSPPVRRVYKILAPPTSLASYNAYRAAVESRGQFASSGRSEGNENRRWHGTRRVCNLGDKGHTQFCSASNCSLCCIIRTSYDISLWGKKTGWGRFGKGIYTSSTSSKSNDYSHNDCKSSLKAILLNKVVVGKGCKLLQDNTSLTAPPVGYDSVLAEKGGSLNYDELVVYSNDAIRPSFLVMYDEP
ncbi:hypothetical protein CVT25_007291 [Psilocybe cyanescens]|uniref:PARP catalytic domain-containing protein n=1 Tax=Psilocybe cyanescens TaxID=93625 RepID=A0A409XP93_PSICY|nr:hypothetical protein CVT25_007291 [Psilocybe cyanescens]